MGSQEDIFPEFSDISVLDCTICLLPLIIPVFQCGNGHITCSSCLVRLQTPKCPFCSCHNLGRIRNRAMEKVLESVTDSCVYKSAGCTAGELVYSAKREHQQTCAYAPYTCPYFKDCGFQGSPLHLYQHLEEAHSKFSARFRSFSRLKIKKGIKFVHLLDNEENGSVVYVLNVRTMKIYSVQDPKLNSEPPQFPYSLQAHTKSNNFVFQPVMVTCRCADDAAWNVPVTEADRSSMAIILDFIFEDSDSIILRMLR